MSDEVREISIEELLALAAGEGEEQLVLDENTTIDEQIERGLREIQSLSDEGKFANEASHKFGIELLQFVAQKARELGLSGAQFGNVFGYLAEVHAFVDASINLNQTRVRQ